MTSDVMAWPLPAGRPEYDVPKRITRPCDYGLWSAVRELETQLGTIEAYNRLCERATYLRSEIDAGRAKPQNPLYAVSVDGSGGKRR